jgi:NAD(P)-dependent dehydrogenase (short-subunit alcohol dehydrogenase family)
MTRWRFHHQYFVALGMVGIPAAAAYASSKSGGAQSHQEPCPLNRFGMPDDVAAMALFLASEESLFVTGSELCIDGGVLAGTATTPTTQEDS